MVSKNANPTAGPTGAKGLHPSTGVVTPASAGDIKPAAKPVPRTRQKLVKPEGPLKRQEARKSAAEDAAAPSASKLRRAAHKEALEQAILDAARALFAERGHEAVTLREVAAAVGYSHATIYSFFADKRSLLARLSEEGAELLRDCLAGQAGPASAGVAERRRALPRMAIAYVRWAVAHPHHYRLLCVDPALDEAAALAAYGLLRATLQQAGSAWPDLDLATQTLWAALHGAALLEVSLSRETGYPWCDFEARLEGLARLIETGFG
ncbi:TetR/AcrR family transcriptional regulator [Paucibacter soli]|uniref:TetR/AcrR family transcriptional regulator n=1 Tax=Paucibacter soli TaxID=3133433 RepID=UPI0030AB56CE